MLKDYLTKRNELFDEKFPCSDLNDMGHAPILRITDLKSFNQETVNGLLEEMEKMVENWKYGYDKYPTMMASKKAFEKGNMARELAEDLSSLLKEQRESLTK